MSIIVLAIFSVYSGSLSILAQPLEGVYKAKAVAQFIAGEQLSSSLTEISVYSDGDCAKLLEQAISMQNRVMVRVLANRASVRGFKDPITMQTLLHRAAFICKDEHIIRLLLDYGVDVNTLDWHKCTPLFIAIIHGNELAAQLFLRYGADANITNSDGMSPLHVVVGGVRSHFPLILLLLQYGASVSIRDGVGRQPLHRAVGPCFEPTVRLLLEWGADANAVDRWGGTPAHSAVYRSNDSNLQVIERVVRLLVNHGADINLEDADGKTPLSLASNNLRKKLEQIDRERLAAIQEWSELLQQRHGIPVDIVKRCILELALPKSLCNRLTETVRLERNSRLIKNTAMNSYCCIL